jgi:hypothetical protein
MKVGIFGTLEISAPVLKKTWWISLAVTPALFPGEMPYIYNATPML